MEPHRLIGFQRRYGATGSVSFAAQTLLDCGSLRPIGSLFINFVVVVSKLTFGQIVICLGQIFLTDVPIGYFPTLKLLTQSLDLDQGLLLVLAK